MEDPKALVTQNPLKKSFLFTPPPVQVYSVRVPPPSFNRNYIRPPTPYPDPDLLTPPASMQRENESYGMNVDIVIKREPGTSREESPPPAYTEESQHVKESDEKGRKRLPRVVLKLSRNVSPPEPGSPLPSPMDTERIEDLMLPPPHHQLPHPPVFLRPNHFRQERDNFIDGLSWQPNGTHNPCFSPLYTVNGRCLVEKKVNQNMFFQIMHPTFNPLILNAEATFLQGACYALYRFNYELVANTINNLLHSPQMDFHMCSKL